MTALRRSSMLLLLLPGLAVAEGHAVGAKVGFLGLGLEYSYELTDRLSIRGGLNGSGYSFDETESGIDYEFDLDFDSWSIGVDVHPTQSAFRISAGLLGNDSALTAIGLPSGDSFVIGDETYTADEVGSLRGSIGFDGTAPFVGIGWDWLRQKKVGMTFEMGLVNQGAPIVSLDAFGPIANDPAFQSDLAAEEAELRDSVDDLDLYPYASFGIAVRF